jgi:hypothetical protein
MLVFAVAALMVLPSATATVVVNGVPAGCGWTLAGRAACAGGTLTMGQFGCFGNEDNGSSGSATGGLTVAPDVPVAAPTRIEYDYTINTADSAAFDGIRVSFINIVTGTESVVDSFNPHATFGDCFNGAGHHVISGIALNANLLNSILKTGNIRVSVYEDSFGDLTGATVSNFAIS